MTIEPRVSVEARPLVQYRSVVVRDADCPHPSGDAPPANGTDRAQAGRHGIILRSDGNDFYPLIRLRYWDAQPESPDGTWDDSSIFDVDFPTGSISVDLLLGGRVGDSISVPTGSYKIKAYRRGNASSSFTGEVPGSPPAEVIEEWIVDFWPSPE
jgi:hypothetical protein